ncbi:RagB/SusD family nutrient uptake outer membrane protein [Muricauda ruestringensis]|uniref:RagB/SusD family nutrient uptake outer membrane protein n=1 Tax=Flagellimonas aurea TaxID=2915619 RepID=A0ABS3G2D5_9FLAO|nr:RagB/SusD family nutrient uptake outer membrane protein [Allomuricauda aurea]MBO0353545.1 RagB/SusD family nutrient uptake outer membrane protein [Allomuricauda aurea]
MKDQQKYGLWVLPLLLMVVFFACSDFVDIEPPRNEIIRETVFTDDASATSAVMGIYSEMANPNNGFINGTSSSVYVLCGFSGDEFIPNSTNVFFNNTILADNATVLNFLWKPAYSYIYYSNAVLEGIKGSTSLSEEVQRQLEGEAKVVRALSYFYLVNLFGDVPIITTTNFEINRVAPKNPIAQVYQQIISDLQDAKELLAVDYSFSNGERVRPNQAVAAALLARVYLFTENWGDVESQATLVINDEKYHLSSDLSKVFLANSEEAIWQLKPVNINNTLEAQYFVPSSGTNIPFASLTESLLNAFEEGDMRPVDWVGDVTPNMETFYFPFKYKIRDTSVPTSEYSMICRLAEQYLIRAEARARQGNLTGALEDINRIRNRAGLGESSANTQEEILDAIMQERRVELFSEGAHRWLDLKRTNRIDEVLVPIKPDWQPTDAFYPIPQKEREANPSLTQNEGY